MGSILGFGSVVGLMVEVKANPEATGFSPAVVALEATGAGLEKEKLKVGSGWTAGVSPAVRMGGVEPVGRFETAAPADILEIRDSCVGGPTLTVLPDEPFTISTNDAFALFSVISLHRLV